MNIFLILSSFKNFLRIFYLDYLQNDFSLYIWFRWLIDKTKLWKKKKFWKTDWQNKNKFVYLIHEFAKANINNSRQLLSWLTNWKFNFSQMRKVHIGIYNFYVIQSIRNLISSEFRLINLMVKCCFCNADLGVRFSH